MSEPEIVIASDADDAADQAARRIAATLEAAVRSRGRADWATTGGSTPIGIYRRLVAPPHRDTVTWDAVHVWWGDDRYVPRDHPWSNVKAFDDVMLAIGSMEEGTAGRPYPGVPLPAGNVHPFPTTEAIADARGTAWCAATYADELRAAELPMVDGWPSFDLLFLGVGPDGHLLSVFADSPALDATELGLGIPAPTHIEPRVERVTLNPAIVGAAKEALTVVQGGDKAAAIAAIFGSDRDPRQWPGQLARRSGATWILDGASAAGLPR